MRRRLAVTVATLGIAATAALGAAGTATAAPGIPPGTVFYSTCVAGGGSAILNGTQYYCSGGQFNGLKIIGSVPSSVD